LELSRICHHSPVSPITRPTRDQVHVFATADELRSWFEANHATAAEAFIGFYRKGVTRTSVTYGQIVEEALCFGWIDGITFRIDDEITANRYTPRRRTSNWSAPNIARVAELRAAGRMHPAGIRAFEERDRSRDVPPASQRPVTLPPEWQARLEADADARRFWEAETPGFRRQATDWVTSARRPETRERRFTKLLTSASAGRRPRAFLVARAAREEAGLT
jgi:uncharacterized protein YdeI (YjbR/CyaY-like superfamily)